MEIGIAAVLIFFLIFSLKLVIEKRGKSIKGKFIDVSLFSENIRSLLDENKSILYFYNPDCRACKIQTPIIDELNDNFKLVGKIDLSKNIEASEEFNIAATPTTAIMKKNRVAEIFVGVKKYDFIKTRFEST